MKKKQVLLILPLLCFLGFLVFAKICPINSFDEGIYQALFSFRNHFWDTFFSNITVCGNTMTVILIVAVSLFFLKKEERYLLLVTVCTTVGMNQLFKFLIQRPRPDHLRLIIEKGYSFPSGHAMISIALYGFFIYFIYQEVKNKYIRWIFLFLFSILILGIGCSRVYLGVHYPSDILGGYCLSLFILLFWIEKIPIWFRGDKNDKNGRK